MSLLSLCAPHFLSLHFLLICLAVIALFGDFFLGCYYQSFTSTKPLKIPFLPLIYENYWRGNIRKK